MLMMYVMLWENSEIKCLIKSQKVFKTLNWVLIDIEYNYKDAIYIMYLENDSLLFLNSFIFI